MGSSLSFIETEKKTWIEHTLKFNQNIREHSLSLINKFGNGKKIYHSYIERKYLEIKYQHWFITDGVVFIEFGSAEDEIYSAIVNVNLLPRNNYEISQTAYMDDTIRDRMKHVIGLKNYSLCLRNCEHISNYIFNGRWISFQMAQNGLIFKLLKCYFMEDKIRLINTFPDSIRPHKMSSNQGKVYDFIDRDFVATNFEYYLDNHENTYNILVVGPTGSGKSRFINVLFNQEICDSDKSLKSVTREIYFIRGQGLIDGKREIIVADTIGLCDTEWSDDYIINLIQDRIHSNMNKLNLIIVVISSSRLQKIFIENIKKLMDWLDYEKNFGRFCFVITHCENISEIKKNQLKDELKSLLDLKKSYNKIYLYENNKKKLVKEEETYRIDCVGLIDSEILNEKGKEEVKNYVELLKKEISYYSKSIQIKNSTRCIIL